MTRTSRSPPRPDHNPKAADDKNQREPQRVTRSFRLGPQDGQPRLLGIYPALGNRRFRIFFHQCLGPSGRTGPRRPPETVEVGLVELTLPLIRVAHVKTIFLGHCLRPIRIVAVRFHPRLHDRAGNQRPVVHPFRASEAFPHQPREQPAEGREGDADEAEIEPGSDGALLHAPPLGRETGAAK